MPSPASQTRVRPRSVACHGSGASHCGPCMLPAICAGPWWCTKLSPPSASNAAATTYSCSVVRGAVGACVAAGRRGCMSRQGTWGSSCAGHAATGPMVMAATADASTVRSVALYCRSPVVSRARCLQAAIQATAPQFVTCGSAPSAPSRPLCCTVVAVLSGGPCCSASGSCAAGGRAGLAAGSPARLGAPGACGTGFAGGVPGLPVVGRGVGAGTSGLLWWTGCGALATVPPRLLGARPRRGAATPGGLGGWTCPRVGCGFAGRATAAAPAPGPALRG